MRTIKPVAAVLAVAASAGCKMNPTADLYSTDLRAAKAGTPDLAAPATLAFQVPGVKNATNTPPRSARSWRESWTISPPTA